MRITEVVQSYRLSNEVALAQEILLNTNQSKNSIRQKYFVVGLQFLEEIWQIFNHIIAVIVRSYSNCWVSVDLYRKTNYTIDFAIQIYI